MEESRAIYSAGKMLAWPICFSGRGAIVHIGIPASEIAAQMKSAVDLLV
jgi:hypothetical protein